VSDPTTYPEWLVGAQRIRRVDGDMSAKDDGFDHEVGVGAVTVKDSTVVDGVDENEKLTLRVQARPFLVAEVVFSFEDCDDAGKCVLKLDERLLGPYRLLTPLAEPLLRWRNSRSLDNLERYLAGRQAEPDDDQ